MTDHRSRAAHAPDHLILLLIRGQVSLVRLPAP